MEAVFCSHALAACHSSPALISAGVHPSRVFHTCESALEPVSDASVDGLSVSCALA